MYAGNNYDIKILSTVDEIVNNKRFATGQIAKKRSTQYLPSSKHLIHQNIYCLCGSERVRSKHQYHTIMSANMYMLDCNTATQ